MNNTNFYQSFSFRTHRFSVWREHDATAGAVMNFLALMRQGRARIVSDEGEISAESGELFFIPKGLSYRSLWEGSPDICWDSYGFDCWPEAEQLYRLQKLPCGGAERALLEELAGQNRVNCHSVALLYELLYRLLPVMESRPAGPEETFRLVTAALREDPACPVERLAARCGISVSGLYALLRRKFDTTPNTLRHRALAAQARELLCTTDLSVEEISGRLGFSSPSYFRKILRQETGMTPTELRRSAQWI